MVFGKGCGVCGDEPLAGIQFEKIQAIIRIFVSYLLAVSLLTPIKFVRNGRKTFQT